MHRAHLLPQKDLDAVVDSLRESGFDVARGVKAGTRKLAQQHPLAISKEIPDIIKIRSSSFTGERAINCVNAIEAFIPFAPRKRIHVKQDDFDMIEQQLKDGGFDVSRGLKAGGAKLIPFKMR